MKVQVAKRVGGVTLGATIDWLADWRIPVRDDIVDVLGVPETVNHVYFRESSVTLFMAPGRSDPGDYLARGWAEVPV